MIAALSFLLECAAIAALLATGASLLVLAVSAVLVPVASRASPSLRADLAFLGGVLPAAAAIAGTLSAAAPPIASALGLATDHCQTHGHHLHLCFVHSAGLRPAIATLGAFSLATFVFRGCSVLSRFLAMRRRLLQLQRLGSIVSGELPVVAVPGPPRMCHATGLLRGRILLSSSLAEGLGPGEVRCALAHEEAHLRRRDPLANLLMSLAGLFVPTPGSRLLQRAYRSAAAEACDADAAAAVGDPALVAEALVKVAAVQRGPWQPAETVPAFGELALERRVRLLLARTGIRSRPTHALLVGVATSLAIALPLLVEAASFHHAVETVLHRLF